MSNSLRKFERGRAQVFGIRKDRGRFLSLLTSPPHGRAFFARLVHHASRRSADTIYPTAFCAQLTKGTGAGLISEITCCEMSAHAWRCAERTPYHGSNYSCPTEFS